MASIYVREKQGSSWRYRRVQEGRGLQTGSLTGPFYTRVIVGGRRNWQRLDAEKFADTKKELSQIGAVLDAARKGLTVAEAQELGNANRIPLRRAVDTYLEQKSGKAHKTRSKYRQALNRFVELAGVRFLDEITVDVLRRYKRRLEDYRYAPGTVDDHLNILYFMFKKVGVTARIPKDEMPVIDEEPAMPYTNEELDRPFAAMDPEQAIRYKFFLGTGCRDKEVSFASWSDLNLERGTYTISGKPDVGFSVKNHEQRTVMLPKSLIEELKARRRNGLHPRWLFVNRDGRPDNHFLRKLKRIAFKARMNCGQCVGAATDDGPARRSKIPVSCANAPVCSRFTLHRFRKTCATRWMEAGISVRRIQYMLGHKDLATTMRYLGIGNLDEIRSQIDAAFGD